jgi:hypothetical protein
VIIKLYRKVQLPILWISIGIVVAAVLIYGFRLTLDEISDENTKSAYASLQYDDAKYKIYSVKYLVVPPSNAAPYSAMAIRGVGRKLQPSDTNPGYAWILLDYTARSEDELVMNSFPSYDYPCSAMDEINRRGIKLNSVSTNFIRRTCVPIPGRTGTAVSSKG